MTTRDLSNKRLRVAVGPQNAIADFDDVTLAEVTALLNISPAVRFDGYDFGVQESDREDDRSLTDDASATTRSFDQFGGGLPLFFPKANDQGSILRQAYNLVKGRNTELCYAEQVGWKDNTAPLAAGDVVNLYRVLTDGWTPDTEGTGGYAYLLNLIARGDVLPWYILPPASPVAVTIAGGATRTLAVDDVAILEAAYQGHQITVQAEWTSSDPTVVSVSKGIAVALKAGTADITATYPGALPSTAVAVTVGT